MAPEKFPCKLKVVPSENKIKVIGKTGTDILGGDGRVVYKADLNGTDRGNASEKVSSWDNTPYNNGDALYIWHIDPKRSIIKGNIENQREDYSDGVDDSDNMNHVVFKLTETGLESVYNEAPTINGVEDKDVYIGQEFNPSAGVTYEDDHDNHLILQME